MHCVIAPNAATWHGPHSLEPVSALHHATATSRMKLSAKPEQSLNFALFLFAYYGYVGVFSPYASLYFAEHGLSVVQIGVLMSLLQVWA